MAGGACHTLIISWVCSTWEGGTKIEFGARHVEMGDDIKLPGIESVFWSWSISAFNCM